eukprot:scaffold360291_cov19-Prasinocladus_malaysianus.AAC.1
MGTMPGGCEASVGSSATIAIWANHEWPEFSSRYERVALSQNIVRAADRGQIISASSEHQGISFGCMNDWVKVRTYVILSRVDTYLIISSKSR